MPYPDLLSASLFIDITSEEDRLWAIDVALRSEATFAVITYLPKLSVAQSRRFSLAIANSDRFAFLLRPPEEQHHPTTTATRWQVKPHLLRERSYSPAWELTLLKQKGAQSKKKRWIVQLDEEFFSQKTAKLQIADKQIAMKSNAPANNDPVNDNPVNYNPVNYDSLNDDSLNDDPATQISSTLPARMVS